MAQIQTVVFLFGVIAVTGTWDGLVRRHIRLSFDGLGMFVLWRGIPAILVGLVSLLLLLFIGLVEVMTIRPVIAACHVMTCTLQQTVLVLFTTWQSIVTVGLFGFLFAYWLWGAFDLRGPYRRQLLAPGVWYKEKEVVALVTQELCAHHLPPIDDDTILRTARTLIINIGKYRSILEDPQDEGEPVTIEALAQVYQEINASRKWRENRGLSEAQRRMATTILRYYLDLHERAVEKWPWLRTLLRY
jgi:hypothetical protein